MTRSRQALLAVVEASDFPLSVADLRAKLSDAFDQATVYRSMHWLTKEGLVEEFAFSCAERGLEHYYVARCKGHRHFFHCETCHAFFPIEGCGVANLAKTLEQEQGFLIDTHTLYFTGRCPDCIKLEENKRTGEPPTSAL